ncbi:hypothetical protein BO78DRAFT_184488 [Aspergillus sclerotiicarbonarius CBS 121057]|uniref:Uncharacterized protein n=1 Tax=Aspergillus sclerotiicarbonarius (strain CBS 121057 / IBT 28362) TaxID=1448318 RepID=A0A319ETV9_ASPSB|nr:hypothetical protein BO78DRAFT_184488 [Aspergillus sclerotiicarbonarius CBS 121057]
MQVSPSPAKIVLCMYYGRFFRPPPEPVRWYSGESRQFDFVTGSRKGNRALPRPWPVISIPSDGLFVLHHWIIPQRILPMYYLWSSILASLFLPSSPFPARDPEGRRRNQTRLHGRATHLGPIRSSSLTNPSWASSCGDSWVQMRGETHG